MTQAYVTDKLRGFNELMTPIMRRKGIVKLTNFSGDSFLNVLYLYIVQDRTKRYCWHMAKQLYK